MGGDGLLASRTLHAYGYGLVLSLFAIYPDQSARLSGLRDRSQTR